MQFNYLGHNFKMIKPFFEVLDGVLNASYYTTFAEIFLALSLNPGTCQFYFLLYRYYCVLIFFPTSPVSHFIFPFSLEHSLSIWLIFSSDWHILHLLSSLPIYFSLNRIRSNSLLLSSHYKRLCFPLKCAIFQL